MKSKFPGLRVLCGPLDCDLSMRACAARSEVANGKRPMKGHNRGHNKAQEVDTSEFYTARLVASPCNGCPVGRESSQAFRHGG